MKRSLFSRSKAPLLTALTLCFTFYGIVYVTGGTRTPYPHLYYFPIMLMALTGTWAETLLVAAAASLMMSAWAMPLSVADGTLQSPMGWIFRAVMFFSVSVFLKLASSARQRQQDKILQASRQMRLFSQSTLNAILHLAETKDPESTGRHLDRITTYARILLEELSLPADEKTCILQAIALHDIGKVAIPDSILLKPGKLTEEEYAVMKRHAVIGGEILQEIQESVPEEDAYLKKLLQTASDIVTCHHERPDGQGYPRGLAQEGIPLSARIAAICDVYDALSSARPYKEPYPHGQCVAIITAERGRQFDPDLVDAFLRVAHRFEAVLSGEADAAPADTFAIS